MYNLLIHLLLDLRQSWRERRRRCEQSFDGRFAGAREWSPEMAMETLCTENLRVLGSDEEGSVEREKRVLVQLLFGRRKA